MTLAQSSSMTICRRGAVLAGGDPTRTVVWVHGEHDAATETALALTIADAARLDDGDLLVDLSAVRFMGAATIGALVGAANRLRAADRALTIRNPSSRARRLLELCALGGLIEPSPEGVPPYGPGAALRTWVAVAPAHTTTTRAASPGIAEARPAGPQAAHASSENAVHRIGP